jgi:hypothetical protein
MYRSKKLPERFDIPAQKSNSASGIAATWGNRQRAVCTRERLPIRTSKTLRVST